MTTMLSIIVLRLCVDFGLVVLIWMVQLIIYPAFKHIDRRTLLAWHSDYTKKIGMIVMPLMGIQLTLVLVQLYQAQNFYTIVSMLLVLLVWISTFSIFVPIHTAITKSTFTQEMGKGLVNKNWLRTLLWSLLFLLNFMA